MKLFPDFGGNLFCVLAVCFIPHEFISIFAARALDDEGARVPDIAQSFKGALKIGTSLSERDRFALNRRIGISQPVFYVNADYATPELSNLIGYRKPACKLIAQIIIYAECL